MFGAEKGSADKLDGKKLSIGMVQARFNEGVGGFFVVKVGLGKNRFRHDELQCEASI